MNKNVRTLKFTLLLLTMLIVSSCSNKDEDVDPLCCMNPLYQHLLWISFQDESGNDLLEGSEFVWSSDYGMRDTSKPEYYTLDVVYEDGIPNPWKPEPKPYVIYDINYPRLYWGKGWLSPPEPLANPYYNYLWFETSSYKFTGFAEALLYGQSIEYCDFAEKIIFRLTCLYLFNDNEAHDIVTWWEIPSGRPDLTICYRIEFEGKEFPVKESIATIILDR